MLIEISDLAGYDKSMAMNRFEILKEFCPEAHVKCDFGSYQLTSSVKTWMYKETLKVDNDVEESVVLKWYDDLSDDDKTKAQLAWNMSKPNPIIEFPNSIIVDMELWNERWLWPYKVVKMIKVHRKNNTDERVLHNLDAVLTTLDEKLELINSASKNLDGNTFNQKCSVHIGGGMLVQINRVKLLEDSCTDVLQMELNSGWRILAVNVQADQRRPDYILGRYDVGYDYDKNCADR